MKRIEKVQKLLVSKEIDAILVEEPVYLFYLTGLKLFSAKLVIDEGTSALFVDNRYLEEARLKFKDSFLYGKEEFLRFCKNKRVAFDSSFMNFDEYHYLSPLMRLVPLKRPLAEIRAIKDDIEIIAMKKAAKINSFGFRHVLEELKSGVSEKELALKYKIFVFKEGAELAFDPIICFGASSSTPHHKNSDRTYKKGELLLIDAGASVDNYCSDMTRTFFFEEKLKKFFELVQEAYFKAKSICQEGTVVKELDLAVRAIFRKAGCEEFFLHNLGHGVGLEVHEYPRINSHGEDKDVVLKAGMTITIEPGLYIENVGGIRYENTILVTKEGCEELC